MDKQLPKNILLDTHEREQILKAAIEAAKAVAINISTDSKQAADVVVAACLSAVDTLDRRILIIRASRNKLIINHELTQYQAWRLWPAHLVAKLFGVRLHVDGFPFGSSRIDRKNWSNNSSSGGTLSDSPSASSASKAP